MDVRGTLLEVCGRDCTLLEKTRISDGEGGYTFEWKDGLTFKNYYAQNTSMEARRAEKEGVTSLYSALVDKSLPINYNDYFRDETTKQTFRITSEPDEKQAPSTATFALKFFTAERRELPRE